VNPNGFLLVVSIAYDKKQLTMKIWKLQENMKLGKLGNNLQLTANGKQWTMDNEICKQISGRDNLK
jgi:hypothetical protein